MPVQSRTMERADDRSRRMPRGLLLLTAGENKLRESNVRAALELFRTIVNRYPPSLEWLAAASYLRDA
jgi:hypothetical protein